MTNRWEDLNARARGLATHLLARGDLDLLARTPDIATLGDALRGHGFPVAEGERSPEALELALRRMAAARLRVLARWAGPRAHALNVLFEDEDRRSLRAVLRGAVQKASADTRMAGLIPTAALPERALRRLAEQSSAAAIAALLTAWRNPYGSAILSLATTANPDLFSLELALNRTFAARAVGAARGTGLLAAYVGETIDLENAYTALVLAVGGKDVVARDAFLAGGDRVSLGVFIEAAAAGDALVAARALSTAFSVSPLARAFQRFAADPGELEDAVLRIRIRELTHATRVDPLGPAPLLAYALRVRAEILDLRRIIWGVTLAAPPVALLQSLVTA
ncbi:MAG TPA: V-type ATPase subunit [Gemmatimonadales bacterium]|nr:V-type ATPase subunit [Gemmatimonadales bacterium]